MLDKFKTMLKPKDEETVIFPTKNKNKNEDNSNQKAPMPPVESIVNDYLKQPSVVQKIADNYEDIINDKIFLKKVATSLLNNSYFIQFLTTNLESQILQTLEKRYDFTPTDKLKELVESSNNELKRINTALEDKTDKLAIVEDKIATAIKEIAPKINEMLTEVAYSVLHKSSTNSNKSE